MVSGAKARKKWGFEMQMGYTDSGTLKSEEEEERGGHTAVH